MVREPIRILIVDDSRIFRGFLEHAFAEIGDTVVVGSVFSGEKALDFLSKTPVDLVTLDIEMPGMDGLSTLRAIRELNRAKPHSNRIETLLVSSLTSKNARCTVEGLQLGAIDFILKPNSASEADNRQQLRKLLIEKLDLLRTKRGFGSPTAAFASTSPKPRSTPSSSTDAQPAGRYQAIAIGISTGGPETLTQLLPEIAGRIRVPLFIVQHNLNGLSNYMAESLSRRIGSEVFESRDGMEVLPNGIYLSQSGSHMVLRRDGNRISIGSTDAPPENHSRPSVDVFLRSAAAVYGPSLIAAIMTGMLNDGANGVRAVKRAGGYVIAQDQASSIIWGMPRAAIETGSVDVVLPLAQFAPTLRTLLGS